MTTRILVINNSDDVLALFNKVLATKDREIFLQVYLNSDLQNVHKIKPNLIILDYYVGREGIGWEFLQLLRMDDAIASIPVLICTTAVKLAYNIAGYLATKRVTVLRKPFESHDLLKAVGEVLSETDSKAQKRTMISRDGDDE